MRRSSDHAVTHSAAAELKSSFLITPIIEQFPVTAVIRKVTPGVDFTIWGYVLVSLSLFILIFFFSYCDEVHNVCNTWEKGHLPKQYVDFFSFEVIKRLFNERLASNVSQTALLACMLHYFLNFFLHSLTIDIGSSTAFQIYSCSAGICFPLFHLSILLIIKYSAPERDMKGKHDAKGWDFRDLAGICFCFLSLFLIFSFLFFLLYSDC